MKYAFAQVAFGLGANALVAREAAQCVQLKASGGASGVLGQLGDGQNRIGGGHDTGCYCLSNGGFTDSKGRGCILTPPTTQFQCDVGATPSTGFAIGSNGGVTSNGNGKFYACPVNEAGEYNVYTQPAPGQAKCVEITLNSAGTCGSSVAPQSSQPAPKPSQPAQSEKPSPKPSQPAQSEKPAPKPSQPSGYSQKPAPTPEQSAPKPSQPAQSQKPQPPASAPVAPAPGTCGPPVTVTMTVTAQKPAPTPEQPASQPAAQPSKPAAQPSQPAPQPSKPAPQPSQPAAQPSKPAAQPSKPAQQPAPKPSGSCPADLNGNYEYPHLIVPVDSSSPNKASGTSYNGKVNKTTCSIFNFDIPASYSGKKCSVVFLFPEKKDLETSDYTVSGSGQCSFSKLSSPANQQTSYANQPSKQSDLASMSIAPGNSYVVASGDCEAGKTVSYEMCSQGDFSLDFFQDYNPSPLGLYVRQC